MNKKSEMFELCERHWNMISTALLFVFAVICLVLQRGSSLSVVTAGITMGLAVLLAFLGHRILLIRNAREEELRQRAENERLQREQMECVNKAKIESLNAAAFDFKMAAPIDSTSFQHLAESWLRGANVDLSALRVGDVRFYENGHKGYIPAQDFLDPDKKWNSSFIVSPMRNADKNGKCIVQLSFIPVDDNGKIPIILRMPSYHFNDIGTDKVQDAKLTFVSFSPVPLSYKRKFAVEDCYHREVPDRTIAGVTREFEELGMAIKRDKNSRFYLFYVFLVRYHGCSFADDNGVLNQAAVNQIFAVSPCESAQDAVYFSKDHDKIIAAASAADIDYVVGSKEHGENAPAWLIKLFLNCDYTVYTRMEGENKVYVDRFDMTKADLGGVEKKIIQKILV